MKACRFACFPDGITRSSSKADPGFLEIMRCSVFGFIAIYNLLPAKNVTAHSVKEFQGQLQDLLKWTLSSVRIGRTPFRRDWGWGNILCMLSCHHSGAIGSKRIPCCSFDSTLAYVYLCVSSMKEFEPGAPLSHISRSIRFGKIINESQKTVSRRQQPQHANISGLHLTLTPLLISTSMPTRLVKKVTEGYSCGPKLQYDSLVYNPIKHGRHAQIDWGEGHPEDSCGSRERRDRLDTVWVPLEFILSSSVVDVLRRVRSARELVIFFFERRAPPRTCEKHWT